MHAIDAEGRAHPRWFAEFLGVEFFLLIFAEGANAGAAAAGEILIALECTVPMRCLVIAPCDAPPLDAIHDSTGALAERYDAKPGTCYLFRPDGHVAARWRSFDRARIIAAINRALGKSGDAA